MPQAQSPPTPTAYTTDTSRWHAVTTRDPASSHAFIYAVRTTKIYCRPTCRSRLARRANITFFENARDAAAAGYRPCKRCQPDQLAPAPDRSTEKVQLMCEMIREAAGRGEKVRLDDLARRSGMSKWHLHRCFKERWGVTPREMGLGLRQGRALSRKGGEKEDGEEESSGNASRSEPATWTTGLSTNTPAVLSIHSADFAMGVPDFAMAGNFGEPFDWYGEWPPEELGQRAQLEGPTGDLEQQALQSLDLDVESWFSQSWPELDAWMVENWGNVIV